MALIASDNRLQRRPVALLAEVGPDAVRVTVDDAQRSPLASFTLADPGRLALQIVAAIDSARERGYQQALRDCHSSLAPAPQGSAP